MTSYYEKWKRYQWYGIVGVLSLISLFFLPMLGSEVGLAWKLPNTVVGWSVFAITKCLTAVLNILIFHSFISQAKLNIKDDKKYLEACEILCDIDTQEDDAPKSPKQYFAAVYGKKGTTLFITSLISSVGLTQAILTFDWVQTLTYLFTVIMGIIFGIIQMNATEDYWTGDYLRYAKKVKKDLELAEKESIKPTDDSTDDSRRASVLESNHCNSTICNSD